MQCCKCPTFSQLTKPCLIKLNRKEEFLVPCNQVYIQFQSLFPPFQSNKRIFHLFDPPTMRHVLGRRNRHHRANVYAGSAITQCHKAPLSSTGTKQKAGRWSRAESVLFGRSIDLSEPQNDRDSRKNNFRRKNETLRHGREREREKTCKKSCFKRTPSERLNDLNELRAE